MKKFNLEGYSVQTDSDEQSRELQEMAFEQGFKWASGDENPINTECRFFMFRDKSITWSQSHAADLKQIHFNEIKKELSRESDCDSEQPKYSEGCKWELEQVVLKEGVWVKIEDEALKEKLAKAEAEVERLKKEIEEHDEPKFRQGDVVLVSNDDDNYRVREYIGITSEGKFLCWYEDKKNALPFKYIKPYKEEIKPGDWCKFWRSDEDFFIVSKLKEIDKDSIPYKCANDIWYKNCEKITNKELIKLLENEK